MRLSRHRELIPRFDLYLSFAGGPILERLRDEFGARAAAALLLQCRAAANTSRLPGTGKRYDLGYLGTYSADRQPALERLVAGARAPMAGRAVLCGRRAVSAKPSPGRRTSTHVEHLPPGNAPQLLQPASASH